jgi:VIT1/CCC1 family predicted Fe2+/Mn2+ transporter
VNPVFTALSTFASFLVFGTIPLIPYILTLGTPLNAFIFSIVGVVLALILLGIVKGKVIGGGVFRSVAEMVLLGGVSAVIAFFVGTFFQM